MVVKVGRFVVLAGLLCCTRQAGAWGWDPIGDITHPDRIIQNTIRETDRAIHDIPNVPRNVVRETTNIGNNIVNTTVKAGSDVVVTVQKAGTDVIATYAKGWRDTTEQTKRSFADIVDAGQAVVRFTGRQLQDDIRSVNNAANRVREGKVVDALWGLAVEPAQATERNFGKAAQESAVINASAQLAATAYGGPAGAAAYAAWSTYNATGDANLALKAGILSAATSAAGGSVGRMPSGNAAELLKKSAVAGAVGGIAVAAAGGDERAVKDAFLKSGGAVLIQGSSNQLRHYSPRASNTLQAIQCISARDVDCLSNTTYARDLKGKILYDERGRPRLDMTPVNPRQRIGQWTSIDPSSAFGKQSAVLADSNIKIARNAGYPNCE